MPQPVARLARACCAPALLALALLCLGACASSRPAPAPAPTVRMAAAPPTAPAASVTPTPSAAAATSTPTATATPAASEVAYIPTASAPSADLHTSAPSTTSTASATAASGPAATATARPTSATRVPTPPAPGTPLPTTETGFLVYAEQRRGQRQPIWTVQGTAKGRVTKNASEFRLSADGRAIAFLRGFPREMWIAGSDGSDRRLLYTAPMDGPLIEGLTWSPNRATVVFGLSCPGCPASQDPGELWAVDTATGEVCKLVDRGAHGPVFSPDSRWLALIAEDGISAQYGPVGLFDLVEGRGRPTFSGFLGVEDLEWAGDSSGFVVAFVTDWNATPIVTELWWVPTSGSRRVLGRLAGVWDVHWQPGGGRMVYRKGEPGGVSRLYLAERDGSDERLIPDSEGMFLLRSGFPAWSPDGRWLLAMREDGTHYLVDIEALAAYPVDMDIVYGWVESDGYLAVKAPNARLEDWRQGEDVPMEVYRCRPLGACAWLGQVPRWAQVGYGRR